MQDLKCFQPSKMFPCKLRIEKVFLAILMNIGMARKDLSDLGGHFDLIILSEAARGYIDI